jgi:hypothetical protein
VIHPRIWSASLPLDLDNYGDLVACLDVRPFNGRELTHAEIASIVRVALDDGPQAAFEWMSEHC